MCCMLHDRVGHCAIRTAFHQLRGNSMAGKIGCHIRHREGPLRLVEFQKNHFLRASQQGNGRTHSLVAWTRAIPRDQRDAVCIEPPAAGRNSKHRTPGLQRQFFRMSVSLAIPYARRNHDEVGEVGSLAQGIDKVPVSFSHGPGYVLRPQALLETIPVGDVLVAQFGHDDSVRSASIIIGHNHRQGHDGEAFEMAMEHAGDIQCNLKSPFLPFVVMHEQQDILHLWFSCQLAHIH